MLNVDYVVSGTSQRRGNRLTVTVELTETRTARVVWAEVYSQAFESTFVILDEIGDRIVASIANEIETVERNRAVLKPPSSLDAWEAHHRGLWHMYRFNRADNERARHFFQTAVELDPTISRAHAGLSFTHFQNAFQGWNERAPEIDRAFGAAGQSLMADDRDPAAHWAMGRALWLRGRQDQSVAELETAVDLSPNFALGSLHACLHPQPGRRSRGGHPVLGPFAAPEPVRSVAFRDARRPCDGPCAPRPVRRGCRMGAQGVRPPERASAYPGDRCLLPGARRAAGRGACQFGVVHASLPQYGIDDFLTAMKFSAEGEAFFRRAAARI